MPLLPEYNEREDFDLEVTITDKDGDPLVPTSAYYSIYDVESEDLVKEWTEFSVNPQGVGTLAVTADDQNIVDDANEFEERVLTVHGVYSGAKEINREYRFKIKNLVVIPKEEPEA